MHDALGDRIKENYENRTRFSLPRRTYTILRLDGCHFHTYTKGLKKPFDFDLIEDFDNAAAATIGQIQGAVLGYTQSDEFSILLTDFNKITSDAWYDGNIQKMVSVAASIMTAEFNKLRARRWRKNRIDFEASRFVAENGMNEEAADNTDFDKYIEFKTAYFDCRVFTIPDPTEVYNLFVWRNNDCARNSINMVAQSIFSHKELQGKSCAEVHDMLHTKNINWAEYPSELKNGRLIVKEYIFDPPTMRDHSKWIIKPAWVFTKNPEPLKNLIPKYE